MEFLGKIFPLFLVVISAFFFMIAGAKNVTADAKQTSFFSPSQLASVFFACMGMIPLYFAYESIIWQAEGRPFHAGDPEKHVELTVGRTYEVLWQDETGKRALIKNKNGKVIYVTFDTPVPRRFFVSDEQVLVSLTP